MKLYFYFLETPHSGKPYIQIEECEVEEKPKTYKPVDKFPKSYSGCYVVKSDIGILSGYRNDKVILAKKNDGLTKKLFSDYLNEKIECKKKEIEELKEKLMAVENMEGKQ